MAKTLQICSSRKPRALRKLQIWQSWLVLSDDSVTWSKMWVSGAGYVKIWWPKTGYVFLGHLVRCGWSHVPWGACGDYTVCLHEAQPEIKLLAFPHHGNGTMAPWGFACLANKSMSSSNQALPRFIWKPAMQMLQRCPFPKPSLSWFLGGWDGALSCFRCGEVKRSKKTCYPIPAQAWSWQPAWEAWVAISKEAISKVSCDLPRVVNKWCNFFGTSHFLFISKSLRITFISIAVNKVGGLDAPSLWFNSFQFLCTPTHVPRMFSVALVPIQFLFVSHMFVAIAYSFPVVFFGQRAMYTGDFYRLSLGWWNAMKRLEVKQKEVKWKGNRHEMNQM